MIEDWNKLASLLRARTPFAFSKLNDGEMNLIVRNNVSVSRGAQEFDDSLANVLLEALCHKQQNYFVGIPCDKCYPELHYKAKELNANASMLANTLINDNFTNTLELLQNELQDRRVVFICNEEAKTDNLPKSIRPYMIIKVPSRNGWSAYNKLQSLYKSCTGGDVVLFCCGPLGRALVYKWYSEMPSLTCIELGSFFDPWTNNRMYSYHSATLRHCSSCNNTPISTGNFLVPTEVAKDCAVERFYYYSVDYNSILAIYNQDKRAALRFYKTAMVNSESSRHAWYYRWCATRLTLELDLVTETEKDTYIESMIQELIKIDSEPIDATFDLALKLTSPSKKIKWMLYCVPLATKYQSISNKQFLNDFLYKVQVLDTLVIDCFYAKLFYHSHICWRVLLNNMYQLPEWQYGRCFDNGRYANFTLDYQAENGEDRFAYEKCLCMYRYAIIPARGSILVRLLDTSAGDGTSTKFFDTLGWNSVLLEHDTSKFLHLMFERKGQVIQTTGPRYNLEETLQWTNIDQFDVVFIDSTADGWYILNNFNFTIQTLTWVVRNIDQGPEFASLIHKRLLAHGFVIYISNDKHCIFVSSKHQENLFTFENETQAIVNMLDV